MKMLSVGLSVLMLAVAVGCSGSSSDGPQAAAPQSDGPQAATPQADGPQTAAPTEREQPNEPVKVVVKKPIAGEADKTFSLKVPFESVTLTQGKEKSMLIGINRGEDFREEVAIEVSGLPKGVTLAAAKPVIKQGDMDATLMLKATPDAALGDFTFKVTGQTSSSGADFSKEINLTVAQK